MEVGLGPVHIVLNGDTAPRSKKGAQRQSPTQFSAHVHCDCGQRAAWIKMPLSTEVGLGLREMVFDVTQLSPEKGHTTPTQFWPMSIVSKWLDGLRRRLVRK